MYGNMPDWYSGDKAERDIMEVGCTEAESHVLISDIESEIDELEAEKMLIEARIDILKEQIDNLKNHFCKERIE